MQELATLNTPILNVPGAKKHHAPWSLVILALLAFVIGAIFWIISRDTPSPSYSTTPEERLRAEVASLLENARAQASPAEVNRVTDTLSKSRVSPSDSDRARVSALLENF